MSLSLFYDPGFKGRSLTLLTSARDFWSTPNFNDQASSVRVHEGTWEIYRHVSYEAPKAKIGPGDYDVDFISKTVGNNAISSAKILDGLTLYTKGNWSGKSLTLSESRANLGDFDDVTTSLIIHNGTWMLYELPDYKGKSYKVTPGKYDADLLINNIGKDSCISSLEKISD